MGNSDLHRAHFSVYEQKRTLDYFILARLCVVRRTGCYGVTPTNCEMLLC